jgi:hypothetical protein
MYTTTITEGETRRLVPTGGNVGGCCSFNVFTDNPTVDVTFTDTGVTIAQDGVEALFTCTVDIVHQGDRAAWRARTFGGN